MTNSEREQRLAEIAERAENGWSRWNDDVVDNIGFYDKDELQPDIRWLLDEIERLNKACDQCVAENAEDLKNWERDLEERDTFKLLCGDMVALIENSLALPKEFWEWQTKAMLAFKDAKGERDE